MTAAAPDSAALIDRAIDEVPQSLFSAADVPLAKAEEILGALQGQAVRAVLAMRIEQMVKHGHNAEGDDMLAIDRLPRPAEFASRAATPGARGSAAAGGDRPA